MSISESQLETWCHQGATVTSAAAYTSIKAALADPKSKVRDLKPETYLQGSYGNSTNIYADSDVDVTVQYNSVYGWDVTALPQGQQVLFGALPTANYTWGQFYTPVLESLRTYFGPASVNPGNKAIKVKLLDRANGGCRTRSAIQKVHFFPDTGNSITCRRGQV